MVLDPPVAPPPPRGVPGALGRPLLGGRLRPSTSRSSRGWSPRGQASLGQLQAEGHRVVVDTDDAEPLRRLRPPARSTLAAGAGRRHVPSLHGSSLSRWDVFRDPEFSARTFPRGEDPTAFFEVVRAATAPPASWLRTVAFADRQRERAIRSVMPSRLRCPQYSSPDSQIWERLGAATEGHPRTSRTESRNCMSEGAFPVEIPGKSPVCSARSKYAVSAITPSGPTSTRCSTNTTPGS